MSDSRHPLLFAGEYDYTTGTFSYEELLLQICPDEFRDLTNEWTSYAVEAIFNGCVADYSTWEWKSADEEVRDMQGHCFSGFLHSVRNLGNMKEDVLTGRAAVLGWMLSNIVTSVPEYRRPQRRAQGRLHGH